MNYGYIIKKPGWLNWFWQFLCDGLSSFNLKGFYCSYSWSCSLCEGRTSFSMGLISRKLCVFLLMFSTVFTSLSVLLLFPLLISFFAFMHVSVSSNIDDVLLINPSANMFVFGDLNVRHKDWLTYSGVWWTPLYFLLSQMTLLKWLTFLLRSLTATLTVLIFWICFFLFILVFVLQWLSLHWEILIILVS